MKGLALYPKGLYITAGLLRACFPAVFSSVESVSGRWATPDGFDAFGLGNAYSHVLPGLQEAAAQRFDDFLSPRAVETENVSKMLANQFETDIGVAGFEPATT